MSFPRYPQYKASGIEWMGNVPSHWQLKPLKAVCTCNDEVLDESTPAEYEIDYVEISDVDEVLGIRATTSLTFGQAASRARRLVKDGDVLISTVRTYLRAITPIIRPAERVVVSTGFAVVRPRFIRGDFLGYLLRAEYYISEVISRSVGVSYPAINASELMRIPVSIPTTEEQMAIATFLDRETRKIDALMAEQGALVTLLKEKRQAVISHAVTKGLNPGAPMKPSGIEWLGDVPVHWDVSELRYVSKPGTSISYGIVQAGPHVEDGIPYIRTSDMAGRALSLEGLLRTSPAIDASYRRSKVYPGDVVIAIRATIGKCLPVPHELAGANLTQGTAKVTPGPEIQTDFLLAYLNSNVAQTYFDLMAKGATFREITIDTLRRTPVLVPPRDEQTAIADRVNALAADLDSLIAEAETAAWLLKERRSALISAAVTGQIDVRGLAA